MLSALLVAVDKNKDPRSVLWATSFFGGTFDVFPITTHNRADHAQPTTTSPSTAVAHGRQISSKAIETKNRSTESALSALQLRARSQPSTKSFSLLLYDLLTTTATAAVIAALAANAACSFHAKGSGWGGRSDHRVTTITTTGYSRFHRLHRHHRHHRRPHHRRCDRSTRGGPGGRHERVGERFQVEATTSMSRRRLKALRKRPLGAAGGIIGRRR